MSSDRIRTAKEVAERTLALFGVWGLTAGAPRKTVLDWLAKNQLFDKLSPVEAGFIDTVKLSKKQRIHLSWQAERLIVLLWALRYIEHLPPANEQCDTSVFEKHLPPFAPVSVKEFVLDAALRTEDELTDFADQCLDLHWHARDAVLNRRVPTVPVDIEVVQERHHAINWVVGYAGLSWDDVTTDT